MISRSKNRSTFAKRSNAPTQSLSSLSYCCKRSAHSKTSRSFADHLESGSDRFIPSRRRMNMDLCRYSFAASKSTKTSASKPLDDSPAAHQRREFHRYMLSTLFDVPLEQLDENAQLKTLFRYGGENSKKCCAAASSQVSVDPFELDLLRCMKIRHANSAPATSPVPPPAREVPALPYLRLDAPGLIDDFYSNLVSWSEDNILAIGLGSAVYLWNAHTCAVELLADFGDHNSVASVKWCTSHGCTHYLAVGTNLNVLVFDVETKRQVYRLAERARASAVAWNDKHHILTAGFRDGVILNVDNRTAAHCVSNFTGHSGEVCGLAWNSDGSCLASGSNDDTVCLWDVSSSAGNYSASSTRPSPNRLFVLDEHVGAVKALAWSPFQRNMLASGGGSKDRTIKLWNATSGSLLSSTNTGSQVSSLLWGNEWCELYSGHGYTDNHIVKWHVPTMSRVVEMKGHSGRILAMDMSPDGSTVVSAGADEVLCFWRVREPVRNPSLRDSAITAGKILFDYPVIR